MNKLSAGREAEKPETQLASGKSTIRPLPKSSMSTPTSIKIRRKKLAVNNAG